MEFRFLFQLDKSYEFDVPFPDSLEVVNTEVLVVADANREAEIARIFSVVEADLRRRLDEAGLREAEGEA